MIRSLTVEQATASNVRLTWDADRALLSVEIQAGRSIDGQDAKAILPIVTGWTSDAKRIDIIVDATEADPVSPSWANAWREWFSARRDRIRVAVVGGTRFDVLTIPVFAVVTGTKIRTFSTHAAAQAWLSQEGF